MAALTIQIFIHAKCDNRVGLWAYEARYWKKDQNTLDDIWNSDDGTIQNTSLQQAYLKAIYEAMVYLNTLTGALKPDTTEITIHLPSSNCLRWLQNNDNQKAMKTNRTKTKRGYKLFVDAILIEMKEWNVEYKQVSSAELPYWLLLKLGWTGGIRE